MLKKITSIMFCSLLTASIVTAEGTGPSKPSLSYFPHNLHQKNLHGCIDCHGPKGPGPIAQFGEKWAHDTCRKCHISKHVGPVECSGCHTDF